MSKTTKTKKTKRVNCRGIMKENSPKYLREKARISERKLALAGAFGPVREALAKETGIKTETKTTKEKTK